MKLSDIVQETYSSLVVNKARSGLTVLGIVIGIGSVIAMVSIGQGAQSTIESSVRSIGSNLLIVMPGAQRAPGSPVSGGIGSAQTLTRADADAIANEIPNVAAVAPENSRRYQVTAKSENTNTQVVGTVSAYTAVRNVQMAEGTFLSDQHLRSASKVAVLGSATRDELFGSSTSALGQTIRINRIDFTVIGITTSKGGSGFGSQDDMIFIPLTTATRFLAGDDYVTTVNVQAETESMMTQIQDDISTLLLDRHNIANAELADFRILNQSDIVATAASVTGTFTLLLGSIAGISLLVGGIGIMNMMLTTVTERTREIGLRKAIGAKRFDISVQFLSESVMLTFFGGFFGIILGWLLALLASSFGGITTTVSWSSVALAFGVSAAIGIVFGWYPARQAARMNPIDALRYE